MRSSRTIALLIWLTASLFYAYQYILRVMPSIMMTDIIQQYQINTIVFGQFSGIYYLGYSLAHLPIGIFLDRFGPRRVMSICILLTVIGLLPLLFSDHWFYPVLGRALIGIGSSAAILGAFKIIRMTFAERLFTRMLSFSVTIGLIGAIYGGGPLALMCKNLGYHEVIQLLACFGLALTALTYLIVPPMKDVAVTSIGANLKEVLSNKKVLGLCLLAGMMVGPLEGFADVWGSHFLNVVYGFSESEASYLPSMIFVGMCFGAPVLSFIAEKSGNYLLAIMGAGIFMLFAFMLLLQAIIGPKSMIVIFILIGVCSAYQILAIYKASTYVSEHAAGLTTAIANMIIMSFGYFFHSSIGFVVNYFGGKEVTLAMVYGIALIPLLLALALPGLFVLWRQDRPNTSKP